MREITRGIIAATALTLLVAGVGSANVLPKKPKDSTAASEAALSGASAILGTINLAQAQNANRSIFWGLAGIALGLGAMSAATSSDAALAPVDVVAGAVSILGGVARISRVEARPNDVVRPARTVRMMNGLRKIGITVGF